MKKLGRTLRKIRSGAKKRVRLLFRSYDRLFLDTNTRCHFIGIGGIGMSALAHIMRGMGFSVRGSDMSESDITAKLQKSGIDVFIGHDRDNITKNIDVIVVSSAIPKNNPEIEKALELGIPIIKRSYVLGQLMKRKKGIAISGTHGKTTTTTMIALLLKEAGLDPIAMIGGEVKNIGGNYLVGEGDYFVAEACEYDRSFLDLVPKIAVLTNIEADHLDYYRDLKEIKKAFIKFVRKLPSDGLLVFSMDDNSAYDVAKEANCRVVGYGFSSKNRMEGLDDINGYWEVEEVIQDNGETRFSLSDGKELGEFSLCIPGKHNVSNACATIIIADYLGIDIDLTRKYLKTFKGSNRRFEWKGEKNGIIVIDDYAHHPTEIRATLEGARKFYKGKNIVVVFEPHQYSRTKLLLKEFGQSFDNADLVVVPDIYAVRDNDSDKKKVSSQDLVAEIKKDGVEALYVSGYDKVIDYLAKNVKKDSVILTVGAGNIYRVGEKFLEK